MDNLTHSLVGLAAAKAGLEKLSPGATAVCLLAANAPDADIVVLFFSDRWGFLQHHRGITHALVGTLNLAILLPVLFYVGDLLLSKLRGRPKHVNFKGLLIASLLVSATHPLLDWTNNYGIRFLLPWNPKWFYGDLVFIVDPFIWLALGSACFLMTSRAKVQWVAWLIVGIALSLLIVGSARGGNLPNPWVVRSIWLGVLAGLVLIRVRKNGGYVNPRLVLSALALVVIYWCCLGVAHTMALSRARQEAAALIGTDEQISRLAAMPTLANPLGWDCVFETNRATYRFKLQLGSGNPVTRQIRYEKPSGNLAAVLNKVSSDRRTQVFLGFARFPVARLSSEDCTTQTLVQLADLRYTEPGTQRGSFTLDLPVECPVLK
jgi:inner membrane protein